MLWRVFCFVMAVLCVAITLDAGWLQIAHDRLPGIGMLVVAALFARDAFKPSRRRA